MNLWALSTWQPKDVLSLGLSSVALIVAIWSTIRSTRLTRRISEMPGRLRRFHLGARPGEDGGGFAATAANGPAATVIAEVVLKCEHVVALRNYFSKSARVIFYFHRRDFEYFGISGPSLPCKLDPHDQAVWSFPVGLERLGSRNGQAHSVAFTFIATTAVGHRYESNTFRLGSTSSTIFDSRDIYYQSISHHLSQLQRLHPDAFNWIEAARISARVIASGETKDNSVGEN
jgi:hypothetical protein